ncbi:MAG: acyl-CoA dehydrogenase family protein [Alcaligenaceae bacterium]|nr:acyl-CoA dehydrogenase family protein [Alcaligenaceae bacterium]
MSFSLILETIRAHAEENLAPLARQIDEEGFYPEKYLRELGTLGGFAALASANASSEQEALAAQINYLRAVGQSCGATAFTAWCQATCAWYLYQSKNPLVKERYFSQVSSGELLAGTGMSNTVKHLSGIEKNNLKAKRTDTGYVISGALPWVSNLAKDHLIAVTAQTEEGGYLMFMVSCAEVGIRLQSCPEFCALEGTGTFNVSFSEVAISESNILAEPDEFESYIKNIKPGFILLQIGMAMGIIDGSLSIIERSNNIANAYLGDVASLKERLNRLSNHVRKLAISAQQGAMPMLPVLYARVEASELALASAQSAALHSGARGYLKHHAVFRRQREAMFVAIVTPSLRHLRREIALLEHAEIAEEAVA